MLTLTFGIRGVLFLAACAVTGPLLFPLLLDKMSNKKKGEKPPAPTPHPEPEEELEEELLYDDDDVDPDAHPHAHELDEDAMDDDAHADDSAGVDADGAEDYDMTAATDGADPQQSEAPFLGKVPSPLTGDLMYKHNSKVPFSEWLALTALPYLMPYILPAGIETLVIFNSMDHICKKHVNSTLANQGKGVRALMKLSPEDLEAIMATLLGTETKLETHKLFALFDMRIKPGQSISKYVAAFNHKVLEIDIEARPNSRTLCCLLLHSLTPELQKAHGMCPTATGPTEWTDYKKLIAYLDSIASMSLQTVGAESSRAASTAPRSNQPKRSHSSASLHGNKGSQHNNNSNQFPKFNELTNQHTGKKVKLFDQTFEVHQKLTKEQCKFHTTKNACFDCHQTGHSAGDAACPMPHAKYSHPLYAEYVRQMQTKKQKN